MSQRGHSAGYFSSYDRGLECLLDMWPKIRERVPDATLFISYGWNAFDSMHRSNPKMMKWRWQMTRKMYDLKDQGVTENGRLSHEQLAEVMKKTKVWAYPTEFNEISCITAMKAQAAGMVPVTTACYGLRETVLDHSFSVPSENIYTGPITQVKFVDSVVEALLSGDQPDGKEAREKFDWFKVASEWDKVLS